MRAHVLCSGSLGGRPVGIKSARRKAEAGMQREREKVRERQKGSKKLQFVSLRPDQGSVGVVCSDRKLASIPLPVYLQEAERDEIRLKVNGI